MYNYMNKIRSDSTLKLIYSDVFFRNYRAAGSEQYDMRDSVLPAGGELAAMGNASRARPPSFFSPSNFWAADVLGVSIGVFRIQSYRSTQSCSEERRISMRFVSSKAKNVERKRNQS